MKRLISGIGIASFAAGLLLTADAGAQQQNLQTKAQAYDVARESALQGTVIAFTENSATPPLGPRVTLQTSSGNVDVHLGDTRLLQANNFTLAAGDSVKVIGENLRVGNGTQFTARVIQKGGQSLVLRSPRGFPLRPAKGTVSGQSARGVL
jgi:hypothetical protein